MCTNQIERLNDYGHKISGTQNALNTREEWKKWQFVY